MASFNRVILMGNLTRDLELRRTPQGTPVVDLGLAVNDRVKKNNEWVDEATFVDITLWGRTAEIASEYLSKGSPVMIEGRLKFESWESEGQKRSKLKVVGERMQLLSSGGTRERSQSQGQYNEPATADVGNPPPSDDSIPF